MKRHHKLILCPTLQYSVIGGRHRQFLSSVTSLWKVLITNENHSFNILYLWTEKMELDKSKGMRKCSVFTSPWQLMVWFSYEQWKRVKEGFGTCAVLPSHKQLDMQVHVLFPEALCKQMLRDGARNYAAQLLVRGKCCICSSLHASPDAGRSGRVNEASEINLILQLWLGVALERN